MGIRAYKESGNVALAAGMVCALRCATEISLLICHRMEISVLGTSGTFAHALVWICGTSSNPNLFRMGREPSVS